MDRYNAIRSVADTAFTIIAVVLVIIIVVLVVKFLIGILIQVLER